MSNFQEATVSSVTNVASFALLSPSFMVYGDYKHLFPIPFPSVQAPTDRTF
jgi:hypothetical protein